MAVVVLQLMICLLMLIQLTLSQSTYGVVQQENDEDSSTLSHLMTVNSQLQTTMSQLQKKCIADSERQLPDANKYVTATER